MSARAGTRATPSGLREDAPLGACGGIAPLKLQLAGGQQGWHSSTLNTGPFFAFLSRPRELVRKDVVRSSLEDLSKNTLSIEQMCTLTLKL